MSRHKASWGLSWHHESNPGLVFIIDLNDTTRAPEWSASVHLSVFSCNLKEAYNTDTIGFSHYPNKNCSETNKAIFQVRPKKIWRWIYSQQLLLIKPKTTQCYNIIGHESSAYPYFTWQHTIISPNFLTTKFGTVKNKVRYRNTLYLYTIDFHPLLSL